jgi:hypothetical protein
LRKSLSSSAIPTSHSFVFPWAFRPKGFAFVVALALAFGGLGVGVSHAEELLGTIGTSTGDASASSSHTLVIGPDGFVCASGMNSSGQLGIGTSEYMVLTTERWTALWWCWARRLWP